MTNHWIDLKNSDVIMVCGSNVAENHPVAARWMEKARERGAVILSADPRFTRTSAFADLYCPLRSGTDIAFVGGMIRYAFANQRVNLDYVRDNTNASFLVKPEYAFEDGLFSGFDPASDSYDKSSWAYQTDEDGVPLRDREMTDPHCVLMLVKHHYKRYDLKTVCGIVGAPRSLYEKFCDLYTGTFQDNRAGTWLYAMGGTQSTHGTQNVRAYSVLQLLLGNIGIAGGGVNALRGESNVQGSTDMALLYSSLPGYLKAPSERHKNLADYLAACTPQSADPRSANWWQNTPKYLVSLLKAWYGPAASAENDFRFDWLPKYGRDCSYVDLFADIEAGGIKGLVLLGQNPAVSGPSAERERASLAKLDWVIAADLFETETAAFWKRPGANPAEIDTEVFLLPACSSVEKAGSITNSGRWAQWREKAVDGPGDSRPDLWILDALFRSLRREYEKGGVFPDPIVNLSWDYDGPGQEPDPVRVAREINGYFLKDATANNRDFKKGDHAPSFAFLTDDGATACGNWLYSGSFPAPDKNRMQDRNKTPEDDRIGLFSGWAWCWPVNRRILYNRASVNAQGQPLNPERWVIRWNPVAGKWEGDVPDGGWPPGERYSFIMLPEGHARLFAASLADGPLPEHYEPWESPVRNALSSRRVNPLILSLVKNGAAGPHGDPERFPVIATTFRVTEHWQGGAMTRNAPWLTELVPNAYVEMSPDLAMIKGIENGDRVVVETARGEIALYALVTRRFAPFRVDGKVIHQVGLIWHFGYEGLARGPSANILTPSATDPNSRIPEYKAFLCDVRKAGKDYA